MSTVPTTAPDTTRVPRVREQARESMALMAVSAAMSLGLAAGVTLMVSLSR